MTTDSGHINHGESELTVMIKLPHVYEAQFLLELHIEPAP